AFAEALFAFQQELGLEVEWCTASRARALEPGLAPGLRGGLWAPGDHQVHNRQLVASLLAACAGAGVGVVPEAVEEVVLEGGAVRALRLASGRTVAAAAVVVAAGCRSGALGGLPARALPAVRPVKGQILRLLPTDEGPRLRRSVRAVVEGASVYLVPRADGSLVVGDSHHYAPTPDPFAQEAVDRLILDEFEAVFGRAAPPVLERWTGTYASAEQPVVIDTPAEGVRLVMVTTGAGASTGFALGEEVAADLFGGAHS
ncbi:MAG TPA: FAD-dependent oxidoreductase, partial [Caulobacteraceae bacterium]|nr:FAD-dependent oxidoreductase [Caulobacteraceae bacterium]